MSYVPVPLLDSLLEWIHRTPDRPAFVTDEAEVSYGEFGLMIRSAAARLRDVGVGNGDRVLICGPNSPSVAAAYFATHAVGAVAVPLDPDIPADAAAQVVEECDASFGLIGVELSVPIPVDHIDDFTQPANNLLVEDWVLRPSMDDVADLLFTTGTTGRKKGVVLTHANIAHAARNINEFIRPCPEDIEVVPIPLSHSFGLGRLRCMAQAGHTLALEPGLRNAARVLKRVLDLRATGLALVPAGIDLILRMTKDAFGRAADHLRYIEIGSAPMPLANKLRLMELLPKTRICHHFGLTEASRAAFIEYHADRDALQSIGRASPNVEITVRDDNGEEVPPQGEGELCVRGGMVMREYWRQPHITREVLRDGWLRTGDWGYQDAAGYMHLVARRKDLINVGGLKVSPVEVEQAINEFHGISESACLGEPDPITGERVAAFLVSDHEFDQTELVAWLRSRLEQYKIPHSFERVVELPKTHSGKLQRHLLRSRSAGPNETELRNDSAQLPLSSQENTPSQ